MNEPNYCLILNDKLSSGLVEPLFDKGCTKTTFTFFYKFFFVVLLVFLLFNKKQQHALARTVEEDYLTEWL